MKLSEYIAREVESQKRNKTAILKELSQKCQVSLLTLQGVERGATMRMYNKAKAVSEATNGEVSVTELCENIPATTPASSSKKKTTKKKRATRK